MAIRNKIAKSFPMWSKGSIIIAQFSKYKITISQNRQSFSMLSILKMFSIFSGSRGPDGPDLPSLFGRKFQLSVHSLPEDERSISRNVANINKLVQDKTNCSFRTFYNMISTESTNIIHMIRGFSSNRAEVLKSWKM